MYISFNISEDAEVLLDEYLHLSKLILYLAMYSNWIVFTTCHICSFFLLCWCEGKGLLLSFLFLRGFVAWISCTAMLFGTVWGHELAVNWCQRCPLESNNAAHIKKLSFKIMVFKVQTDSGNTAPWRLRPFARSSRGKYFIITLAEGFCFKRL